MIAFYRNKWLIQQSDAVEPYVTHRFGGAAQFKEKAERQNKYAVDIRNY